MSVLYAYICTKQTADPYVPPYATNLSTLARDAADGFAALSGGYLRVGQISFFPVQRAVPFHLLCDGKEVPKALFPELFEYLGNAEGTPTDAANFILPNFIGAIDPATTAVPETVTESTVTSETPTSGTGGSGGSVNAAVTSGARYKYGSILIGGEEP